MDITDRQWRHVMGQLTAGDLKSMNPEEIVEAEEAGKLNQLLGRDTRPPNDRQLTEQDLKHMSPEQIEDARERGQLNQLLGRSD